VDTFPTRTVVEVRPVVSLKAAAGMAGRPEEPEVDEEAAVVVVDELVDEQAVRVVATTTALSATAVDRRRHHGTA
jgi:trehalose-6-phosphatase